MDILLNTENAQPLYVLYHMPVRTCHLFTRRLPTAEVEYQFPKSA